MGIERLEEKPKVVSCFRCGDSQVQLLVKERDNRGKASKYICINCSKKGY